MRSEKHFISNGDGWKLSLQQTWDEAKLVRGRRPLLIVPGYGMNSFIFAFHPGGLSLEGYLVDQGFEVWRVDLRSQGESFFVGNGGDRASRDDYGLADLAEKDLSTAIDAALAHTRTGADRADVLGCSLGGTIMFAHAVLNPSNRIGSMVALGTPVRWVSAHPLVRAAFAWPTLVGAIRLRGMRKLAELALPQLAHRAPWLLSIYLNPEITDTAAAREMVKTVEDPNRHVNREIARWIRDRDLVLRGVNVSEGLKLIRNPFLCVLAKGDGIVPADTAGYAYGAVSSPSKKLLSVGTEEIRLAHADLFISRECHERVFAPVAEWLSAQNAQF